MLNEQIKNFDNKELELPETLLISDIDNRVFQSIILQSILHIEGIYLLEGNLIDNLLGRKMDERVTGIHVEQDQKSPSLKVKVEIDIAYGACIPEKAEELQMKIIEDLSRLTKLHVASVHIIFKHLILSSLSFEANKKESLESGETHALI